MPLTLVDFIDRLSETFADMSAGSLAVGVVSTVLGGLVVVFVAGLSIRVWKGFSKLFWRTSAHLGAMPGFRGVVIRGYLRRMRKKFGTVRNIYLDQNDELDLHHVFVPLTLRARGSESNQSTDDIITIPQTTQEILTQNPRLVILGAPGSGKTTLLKALASGVGQRHWQEWEKLIPIFVSLGEFSRAQGEPELYDWLARTLLLEKYGLKQSEPLLKKLLVKGRLLLLLDGLDEVNSGNLPSVLTRIDTFLGEDGDGQGNNKNTRCRILLTCREQNYDLISDNIVLLRTRGMREYRLTDMRDGEVDAMVHTRSQDFHENGKCISSFLDAIRAVPRVYELHRNPLLLTLSIALYLYRPDNTVPQTRTEFYEWGIQHLFQRHDFLDDRQRPSKNQFEMRPKYALLRRFALKSMESASAQGVDFEAFPVVDLIQSAKDLANSFPEIRQKEARKLVMEIRDEAGLICGSREGYDDGVYTFAHRSFHEYCTARELADLDNKGFQRLREHLIHPAWRQTVLFYCGIDHCHAEQVVEHLLETSGSASLIDDIDGIELAGHCAAALVAPQVGLRLRVVMALGEALSTIQDTDARHRLLLSLLEIGRETPPEVHTAVDKILRASVISEDPVEFTANLDRLGKTAALPLLNFMANSGDLAQQQAALRSVMELKGLEQIDLLWQLLAVFQVQKDGVRAAETRRQLLARMPEDGAVARLNSLPVHFREMEDSELRAIYPFPDAEGRVVKTNFTCLLKLEADAINGALASHDYLKNPGTPWERFLGLVVGPKGPRKRKDWKNLPADRSRRIWAVPWQWLGRIGVGVGLLAGLWATMLVFMDGSDGVSDMDGASFPFWIVMTVFAGFITALLWPLWNGIAKAIGWIEEHGVLSGKLDGLLEGLARRTLLFCPFILYWALVPWINHSNLEEHGKRVNSIAFLSDNQRIFTGNMDNIAPFKAANTWEMNRSFPHSPKSVTSVAFSPNGQRVLTGSKDGTAVLWDINTAKKNRFQRSSTVTSVAFSPDSQRVLTGSEDGTAVLWEIDTEDAIRRFQHSSAVTSVAFSPDGQQVLTGSRDKTAVLWKTDTGEAIYCLPHSGGVTSVAFSPDGQEILTNFRKDGNDITLLWSVDIGTEIHRFKHSSWVSSVAFSPNGHRILTGFFNSGAVLWDVDTKEKIRNVAPSENITSVVFSPDGQWILTASGGKTAVLWDANSGQKLHRFNHLIGVNSVAFSPDGKMVLTASEDGLVRIWDSDSLLTDFASFRNESFVPLWNDFFVPFWNESFIPFCNGFIVLFWNEFLVSFWNEFTWKYDVPAFLLLVFLFGFFPTTKLFDPGRRLYLPKKPNPYIHLYYIPGVEKWLPGQIYDREDKYRVWTRSFTRFGSVYDTEGSSLRPAERRLSLISWAMPNLLKPGKYFQWLV
uniref:WD40 repeat n=1 Tax=Candidatus Kentrum sp. DK TaxID=2126562 RepID=A0A450SAN6_9GAMM|nr:MAG: WD40 repeat [Candidatus Kentron sp. DK]